MSSRRSAVGLAAVGLVTTLMASGTGQPALAAATPVTASITTAVSALFADPTNRATEDEKIKAAGALGLNPGVDMLVLDDQAFVLSLWRQAKDGSFVKAEALRAYDTADADAAYEFITAGVFTAAADDARAEIAEANARALRRSVAVIVKLDPADTTLVEQKDRDFIFSVFQRVKEGSHVWTAAKAAIADGTDQDDWTAFLRTGAAAAAEKDLQEEIKNKTEAEAARLRAEQLANAKTSLLQMLLLPVTNELVNAPNRQFVLYIHNNAQGAEVRLASQVALNAPDAKLDQALKDFIFTGGAKANKLDEDVAAKRELENLRKQVTKIRDDAKNDVLARHVLAAAEKALADNTFVALQKFLLKGHQDARLQDNAVRAQRTWDFTGDKKPDILAAEAATGALWLYQGNGDGTFQEGRTKIGSGWNKHTAIFSPGDFSGDGFADVLVRNTAGELLLYRGNGKGGWLNGTAPEKIGSGWNKHTAILSPGDFTGDGFADVLVRNTAGELLLYRGNGKGAWLNGTAPDKIGSGWNKHTAILSPGDFTGDNFSDVIIRNAAGELLLYRGDGKGGWLNGTAPDKIGSGWNQWNMIFSPGDWTMDGYPDIIVRNTAGELRLYRGNGKGGWIDPASNLLIRRSGWNQFSFIL
ncbi:FG-GAP repeat domain-containing protein [Couchioplanes caeruleus]|uniref:VCBS repeat protein n=2 Tax=Couchioplanes caeruleus TaxID=56438 RepID=A0A1K0GKK0_9ACTN|nr:VCBS repeat-containing protein [Couchioplanes caeruleus]OJF11524.1 hypothetical protein BG844_25830 [Couchioplanes caeruleus subsp. caeruleus]ROP31272.1 VCBS repeat protein [Couchioplanes caeruleus]